ncbi:MAG: phosphatase PAP2 family protein [Gaiellaceae bacterium]
MIRRRRTTSSTRPPSTSATRSRVEFVPRSTAATRTRSSLDSPAVATWARERRQGLAQVALFVAAVQVYEALRRVLDPDWAAAVENARRIGELERLAGFGVERGLQRAFLEAPHLVQVLNVFYLAGHFAFTGAFFIWLYRASPGRFRLFRDGLLVTTALALVVHWVFPTAPPRLAGVGLVDTLRLHTGIDIGSSAASDYYNPVAAVPSLHAAYAVGVGVGVALVAGSLAARALGLAYPFAVVLAIVVTGNHFFLDAAAGVVTLGAGFLLAGWYNRRQRRGVEQSGSSPGS